MGFVPAVAGLFGTGAVAGAGIKKSMDQSAEWKKQEEDARTQAALIRKTFEEDFALETTGAGKPAPGLADKPIEDARQAEIRRQLARAGMGRSGSFLTGPGGTLANKSLLGG